VLDFFSPAFAKATTNLQSFVSQSNDFDVFDPDVVAQRLRGTGMLCFENFTHLDLSRNTLTDHEFSRMLEQQVWVLAEMPSNRETDALTHVSKMKSLSLQVCKLKATQSKWAGVCGVNGMPAGVSNLFVWLLDVLM